MTGQLSLQEHNIQVTLGQEARCVECGTHGKVRPLGGLFDILWPER